MARQAAETATALANRLQPYLDTSVKTTVDNHQATWAAIGNDVSDVQSVMIHSTEGWPTRDKAADLGKMIYDKAAAGVKYGSSPHYYVSGDGTVFKIFDENRVLWHGNEQNNHSIGVETGNLVSVGGPAGGPGGPWTNVNAPMYNWMPLTDAAEDLPNFKLYICRANGEIVISYWTVNSPTRADAEIPRGRLMRFTEKQYRGWRLLARYLAEVWRIPRNLSLHPWQTRAHMNAADKSEMYRSILNADACKETLVPMLAKAPINCTTLDSDSADDFRKRYAAQTTSPVIEVTDPETKEKKKVTLKARNAFWNKMFDAYRGFHSHAYSGAISLEDHGDCAGPLFDYNRFARDIWDFWWFPCDLAAGPNPGDAIQVIETRRDYGRTQGNLNEYYWDNVPARYNQRTTSGFYGVTQEFGVPDDPAIKDLPEVVNHYWGYWHGGLHFNLTAAAPIYAAAGGQVVAARFPAAYPAGQNRDDPEGSLTSTRFVLLRHEVFHQRAAGGNRINYNQEPSYVYSLYMHLGAPQNMSFTNIIDANPEWLNRLLMVKKEYDAGIRFHTAHPQPAAYWGTLPNRWETQRQTFDPILTALQNGNVAVFPEGDNAIQLSLGDFLGNAGHMAEVPHAIHFEVFSGQNIDATQFHSHAVNPAGPFYGRAVQDRVTQFFDQTFVRTTVPNYRQMRRQTPAIATALFQNEALQFKSEWALQESDFHKGLWPQFQPHMWWQDVVPTMNAVAPAAAQLPADANVFHYHPLGFMAWLNRITWASELSKFRLPSPSQTDDRPPRRR
jgi:hypothetical protein